LNVFQPKNGRFFLVYPKEAQEGAFVFLSRIGDSMLSRTLKSPHYTQFFSKEHVLKHLVRENHAVEVCAFQTSACNPKEKTLDSKGMLLQQLRMHNSRNFWMLT
jgi:hypothetical protein